MSGVQREHWQSVSHIVSVNQYGTVCRDGSAVKIVRISDSEIRVGCTQVTVAALERLLSLAKNSGVLQNGAE